MSNQLDGQGEFALLQRNMESFDRKLDALANRLSEYVLSAEFDRRINAVEVRVDAIEKQYTHDKQWANDQHVQLKAEFVLEAKAIRTEMQNANAGMSDKMEEMKEEIHTDSTTRNRMWLGILLSPLLYLLVDLIMKYGFPK